MGKGRKIVIWIIAGITGLFLIGGLWMGLWTYYYPEEYAVYEKEREQEQLQQEKIQSAIDEGIKTDLSREMTLSQYQEYTKALQQKGVEEMKQLPASCKGVSSMELDIYPTGKECFSALNERVEEWCLSESDGHKGMADDCVNQFYLKLAQQCKDPVIGSVEVCLMYTFKELYPKLIP